MTAFFNMFVGWWSRIIELFESYSFELYGVTVNLAGVIFAFIVINIVVSVMWKGAQG